MLGAAVALERALPGIEVDAVVGRQVFAGIAVLQHLRAAGELGPVAVIHLGNNGTFTAGQFDELMDLLRGVRRVVFVNDKVPRAWQGSNDAVISAGVRRYANARLADWYAASIGRPEYFWADGIHLRPEGAAAYAALIAGAVAEP